MTKKTINNQEASFFQSINITKDWCKDWSEDLLSDEVLADRIAELIKTKTGQRGFFAYTLSDLDCKLLDKLPTSLIFKFREQGQSVVEITIKNLIMSTAQIIDHRIKNNKVYEEISSKISDRCINLLQELDTNLVTQNINLMLKNLDSMGNSMDRSSKYSEEQKKLIKEKIKQICK